VPREKESGRCAAVKIPKKGSLKSSPGAPETSQSVYLGDFKEILEFLCSVSPEGVLLRAPGSLMVFVEGGKWKAKLKDKEEGLYCFVSADGPDGLLEAVEKGLADGTHDWRVDQEYTSTGRKK
jgi:hypothetical protein